MECWGNCLAHCWLSDGAAPQGLCVAWLVGPTALPRAGCWGSVHPHTALLIWQLAAL